MIILNVIRVYAGYFFLIIGSLFLFLGPLGILRFPDVYNRLQAGTKSTTLGAISALFGIGLLEPGWLGKIVILILFILLTNPVSSHAIGRSAYRSKVPLCGKSVVDKCEEEHIYKEAK